MAGEIQHQVSPGMMTETGVIPKLVYGEIQRQQSSEVMAGKILRLA